MEGTPQTFVGEVSLLSRPNPVRAQVLGFPGLPVLRVTWDELLLNTGFGMLDGLNWELVWFGFRWIVQAGRANGFFTDFPLRTPTIQPGPFLTTYRATHPDVRARSDGQLADAFTDFPVDP